ncbi:MAG: phosphoglycerate dehydrogenase [Oscillospiraceae bacterium]|nr:phosphoglycerate dehydrogenase [Oscillospiraceae bacterium]
MKPIVAFPFRHHGELVSPDAKKMLLDAGFELVCNDTGRRLTVEEQKEMIRDAFAVVSGTEQYDEDMLSAAPNLKVVIRFGVGTDNFDLAAMKRRGIAVGVISNNNCVAEFAVTLILGVIKNIRLFDQTVREGGWARYTMHELKSKTVGIVGFGRIGKRLAQLLQGFDVEMLTYDPYVKEEEAAALNVKPVSLETLLAESDVVSLHIPATPQTRHLINKDTIAMMKDGAYLVNTSRGALIHEPSLVEALQSGKLAGAALDVYEREPVTEDLALGKLDNTLLAPHVAALSVETNYNAGITSAESIIRVFHGGTPLYPVQ